MATDDEASSRSPRRRSGELSGLVLAVLRRARQPLTPGQVLERLRAGGSGPLAYSTVVTILSRMHRQGMVSRERAGRGYAYVAVADAHRAAGQMRRVLDSERDRDAVLTRFVGSLSERDEQLLRRLLSDDPLGQPD